MIDFQLSVPLQRRPAPPPPTQTKVSCPHAHAASWSHLSLALLLPSRSATSRAVAQSEDGRGRGGTDSRLPHPVVRTGMLERVQPITSTPLDASGCAWRWRCRRRVAEERHSGRGGRDCVTEGEHSDKRQPACIEARSNSTHTGQQPTQRTGRREEQRRREEAQDAHFTPRFPWGCGALCCSRVLLCLFRCPSCPASANGSTARRVSVSSLPRMEVKKSSCTNRPSLQRGSDPWQRRNRSNTNWRRMIMEERRPSMSRDPRGRLSRGHRSQDRGTMDARMERRRRLQERDSLLPRRDRPLRLLHRLHRASHASPVSPRLRRHRLRLLLHSKKKRTEPQRTPAPRTHRDDDRREEQRQSPGPPAGHKQVK